MREETNQPDPPKSAARLMSGINPEHLTWDDLDQEVAALEERIVGETGFGVEHWVHSTWGEEFSSYVLFSKNPGWLEAKRHKS